MAAEDAKRSDWSELNETEPAQEEDDSPKLDSAPSWKGKKSKDITVGDNHLPVVSDDVDDSDGSIAHDDDGTFETKVSVFGKPLETTAYSEVMPAGRPDVLSMAKGRGGSLHSGASMVSLQEWYSSRIVLPVSVGDRPVSALVGHFDRR